MLTPNEILAQAGVLQDYMTALRRDVHAHPELGGDEHRTQALILRELAEMGIVLSVSRQMPAPQNG